MTTILLLIASNLFMTLAWYGHLKFTDRPLLIVIAVSWGIALIEYCLAVPANRIGYMQGFSAGELKVIQEVITLTVFGGFALLYLGETLRWNHLAAFACLIGAAAFMFLDRWAPVA